MIGESGGRCTIKLIGENNIKVGNIVQKMCDSNVFLSKQSFVHSLISNLSEKKLINLYKKEVLQKVKIK